jgi:hypothetical protein
LKNSKQDKLGATTKAPFFCVMIKSWCGEMKEKNEAGDQLAARLIIA